MNILTSTLSFKSSATKGRRCSELYEIGTLKKAADSACLQTNNPLDSVPSACITSLIGLLSSTYSP